MGTKQLVLNVWRVAATRAISFLPSVYGAVRCGLPLNYRRAGRLTEVHRRPLRPPTAIRRRTFFDLVASGPYTFAPAGDHTKSTERRGRKVGEGIMARQDISQGTFRRTTKAQVLLVVILKGQGFCPAATASHCSVATISIPSASLRTASSNAVTRAVRANARHSPSTADGTSD
jgi:hypothetical protein